MAKYRKFFRNEKGKRESKTFSSKADADKWAREKLIAKERQRAGLTTEIESITLEEYSKFWLLSREAQKKPIGSWQQDEIRLRLYVIPELGERELHRVPTKDISRFLDQTMIAHQLSSATRNRIRSLLSKLYSDARRDGYCLYNPVRDIKKLPEAQDEWSFLESKEAVMTYLECSKNESRAYHVFSVISLMTGARMGEVLALKVEDIDLVNKRICFSKIFEAASNKVVSRTKGKRNRYVGLNKNITSVVEEFLKLHKRPPSAYLISEDGKAPVGPRSIRRMHDRVIKKGKLKTITPHDLRHTYASHFVMNGGNLMILKEILGHTAYETTLRYAHLAPGHLESQASIVNFDTTDVATADENASEERLKNVIDFTRKS